MRNSLIVSKLNEKTQVVHVENHVNPDLDDLDTIELTQTGKFSWFISLVAGIGGMLFGYDTGLISAVLVYLYDDLGHELSPGEKELITSIMSGAAFFGAIIAGLTADQFGRKGAIYAGCVLSSSEPSY